MDFRILNPLDHDYDEYFEYDEYFNVLLDSICQLFIHIYKCDWSILIFCWCNYFIFRLRLMLFSFHKVIFRNRISLRTIWNWCIFVGKIFLPLLFILWYFMFRLSVFTWVDFDKLYLSKKLSTSSTFPNLFVNNCTKEICIIF